MRKFFSAALALALCVPLAACSLGGNGTGDDDKEHSHNFTWTGDETHHWMACDGCDETKDYGLHIDANADAECDTCHRSVTIHPDDGHGSGEEDEGGGGDTGGEEENPQDFPAQAGQDTKNYYLVGTLGAFGMNWQEELWPDLKFARSENTDESGLTVYTMVFDLCEGDKFKVVNDGGMEYYDGSFDFSFVRGGDAFSKFMQSSGSGMSIVLLPGNAGKYKVTLHTHPTDGTQSYLMIDFVGGAPHTHAFSEEWSFDPAYHWHAATCGHTMSADKAQHTFSNGVCTVCGYGNPPKEDDPVEGGGDEGGGDVGGGDVGGGDIETGDFEFGDSVSYQNDDFYKAYTKADKELYYTLWKETTSVSLKVDITPYELYKLNDQARGPLEVQETYRKCNLTITVNGKDYYYDEVGIRMRGNTSRTEFCDQNGNIYNFVHFRFSLSETFDGEEYEAGSWGAELYHDWSNDPNGRSKRKDRAFATMEKFYYKWNKNYDQTYIREVYANRMFQAYGILAPHITLTQLSVKQNGNMESLGVGNLYETIDKAFIKRNFDKANKGGDLYKCSYLGMGPADLTSTNGAGLYDGCTYELKTNDDPDEFNNHKDLTAFVDMLKIRDQNAFMQKLESMIDMDYFARFEAVNYLAGNPDCIRNNANNYYLYFTPAGKAYLIPYDYDRCFGINKDWNPWEGMVYADPYTLDTTCGGCNNPLYTRTILEGGIKKYQTMYQGWLQKVLDGEWFTYAHFKPLYDSYKKTYNDLTAPSRNLRLELDTSRFYFSESGTEDFGSTWENISMEKYMEVKRRTALDLIDRI